MAKFLNTSATTYPLEELIKKTRERLIIISPFLKFNDRIKGVYSDKFLSGPPRQMLCKRASKEVLLSAGKVATSDSIKKTIKKVRYLFPLAERYRHLTFL